MEGLSTYNDKGEEIPSGDPTSLHVKFRRPLPLAERVRDLVRSENLRMLAEAQSLESFEEADDFNIPDDPIDPTTPYEEDFEPTVPGITAKQQSIRAGITADVPRDRLIKANEAVRRIQEAKAQVADLEVRKRKIAEGKPDPGPVLPKVEAE